MNRFRHRERSAGIKGSMLSMEEQLEEVSPMHY